MQQRAVERGGFRDQHRARRDIENLSRRVDASTLAQIETRLAALPDPDFALQALLAFEQRQPEAFHALVRSRAELDELLAVFSYSRFLTEELMQHPEWLPAPADLQSPLGDDEYLARLRGFLGPAEEAPSVIDLARFRRQQILRVLIRDVLGFAGLAEVTEELSNSADAILQLAYERLRAMLVARYGVPHYADASGESRECGMAVIALGKLGGRELNYSSDIDLMFVYTAAGETDGPQPISNNEFYKKLANAYTGLLSTYTADGLCYRVDLRLRPDGSLGEVCMSLDGAKKYYETRARDWELQMMIKSRVAAGDAGTGRALLEFVEPLTYSTTTDFSTIEAVSATRERIGEKLNRRKAANPGLNIKLAPGGIRDIEFLVQCLQRLYGGRVPWVRHGGTQLALARLSDKDLLSPSEFARLSSAYRFLRNLEHRLQFAEDRQTHTLPTTADELDLLARKMPRAQFDDEATGGKLLETLHTHLAAVRDIYDRVVHANRPAAYATAAVPPEETLHALKDVDPPLPPRGNVARALQGLERPKFEALIAQTPPRFGARALETFLEKAADAPAALDLLEENPAAARCLLDIFEHSPYFADELIRTPGLVADIAQAAHEPYTASAERVQDVTELRRWYRREMFRLLTASVCLREPVFDTLQRMSDLAEAGVRAAYRIAVEQTLAAHPPVGSYAARDQLMVIALGRLGMREFDLGSDADLVFVLPDADMGQQLFWTHVANRVVDVLSAYTGAGLLFSIDTRLRPNGSAGAIVQPASAYHDYFAKSAAAWEGISYMKARAVAGNIESATAFLNALQEVDWRRYGQSGRSRNDLKHMRMRLEREQGASNPLKAGAGGFYDIDFSLLYLRLKGAGLFYTVLNTPARIDIIEKMGHLERADAEFLLDAATFYRAIDHGLRIYSGHAEGNLPTSDAQLAALTSLVHRWVPERLTAQPLPAQLDHIRHRTREIFDRLFDAVA